MQVLTTASTPLHPSSQVTRSNVSSRRCSSSSSSRGSRGMKRRSDLCRRAPRPSSN